MVSTVAARVRRRFSSAATAAVAVLLLLVVLELFVVSAVGATTTAGASSARATTSRGRGPLPLSSSFSPTTRKRRTTTTTVPTATASSAAYNGVRGTIVAVEPFLLRCPYGTAETKAAATWWLSDLRGGGGGEGKNLNRDAVGLVAASSTATSRKAVVVAATARGGGATTKQKRTGRNAKRQGEGGGGTSTIAASVFNLVNNVAGAGILALSAGQAAGSGWIPSIAICALLGVISTHTFIIIGQACDIADQQDFKVRARCVCKYSTGRKSHTVAQKLFRRTSFSTVHFHGGCCLLTCFRAISCLLSCLLSLIIRACGSSHSEKIRRTLWTL